MIQPIRTNVLVKSYPSDEISEGGIFVAESYRKPSNKVKIIAVGNGTKEKPMRLSIGQTAYKVFDWGTPIEENGELFFLMDQDAILATD